MRTHDGNDWLLRHVVLRRRALLAIMIDTIVCSPVAGLPDLLARPLPGPLGRDGSIRKWR